MIKLNVARPRFELNVRQLDVLNLNVARIVLKLHFAVAILKRNHAQLNGLNHLVEILLGQLLLTQGPSKKLDCSERR